MEPVGCEMNESNMPGPFQSPLWEHWDLIKSMRKRRKMWKEIAEVLKREHGLETSHKTIQNFFKRASNPKQKRPMGWDDPVKSQTPPDKPSAPRTNPPAAAPEVPGNPAASVKEKYAKH